MKPEQSEQLFVEAIFDNTKRRINREDIELLNIDRLTGDASTRRYYRLETNEKTYVVCIDSPSESGENPFVQVQGFLEEHRIRVPKIIDKNVKRGYILEEDLGDVTLLQHLSGLSGKEEEFKVYKEIIDLLLDIHKISTNDIEKSKLFHLKFDQKKYEDEIDFTVKFFMKKFLKITCEKSIACVSEQFKPICERLAAEKMVLTHRDFHSRNIMVKDNEFIVIDFQDARWGIPQYDLVSMLEDCYYDLDRSNKYELVKYYWESLPKEAHGQKDFDHFMQLYHDMALQRVFKAVGSFSYIYETRKDVRYVKYIGFAMEKIKKILMNDSRYNELRKTLFKFYYES